MRVRTYSTVDWRKYLVEDYNPRVKNFLESRGESVFQQISTNVNSAVMRGKSQIVLLVHPNVGNIIVIEKKDFKKVLQLSLDWFLKKEKYEMCSTIKGYLDNLKTPKRRVRKTNKTLIWYIYIK